MIAYVDAFTARATLSVFRNAAVAFGAARALAARAEERTQVLVERLDLARESLYHYETVLDALRRMMAAPRPLGQIS